MTTALSMTPTRARERLRSRETELRALLAATDGAPDEPAGVVDFKDLAAGEVQSALDDATSARAADELAQVTAALQRLATGRYGLCLDCGEAIDARRLSALPATAYCASCQEAQELRGKPGS